MLALWTVLLWERKLGLAALEEAGVSRFDLVRGLDKLLQENTSELPLAFDKQHAIVSDKHQNAVVVGKTGHSDGAWDFEDLLEPVIRQAEHEANELGHNYVGSEHLVLALVKLADPLLATLLKQHGVTYEKVREAVVRLLQPDKPTPLVD
jgi:ATP-dependent Clp protease ATP-binding subunit ClpA